MRLVVEDIHKSFGNRKILAGVSGEFRLGLSIIIGPNGIGKSTLLRIIAGLYRPDRGIVYVKGIGKPVRKVTYYLPEMLSPIAVDYTFWDLMKLLGIKEISRELPSRLGLTDEDLRKPISKLSAGMRKKVLFLTSLALSDEKPIILYDEPFANLDPTAVRRVQEMILNLSRDHILIVSTHILTAEFVKPEKGSMPEMFTLVRGTILRVDPSLIDEAMSLKIVEGSCESLAPLAKEARQVSRLGNDECRVYVRPSADILSKVTGLRGVTIRDAEMADIYELLVGERVR